MDPINDILVIGGGSDGCGVVRDAGCPHDFLSKMHVHASISAAASRLVRDTRRHPFRLIQRAMARRETLWASSLQLFSTVMNKRSGAPTGGKQKHA